ALWSFALCLMNANVHNGRADFIGDASNGVGIAVQQCVVGDLRFFQPVGRRNFYGVESADELQRPAPLECLGNFPYNFMYPFCQLAGGTASFSNLEMIARLGKAPTVLSRTSPPAKYSRVGMDWIPKRAANSWF